MSVFVDVVVAGPILWLAVLAAASWEAPLTVSPPPFRSLSFRRSPSELLLVALLDRSADHGTGASPVRGRGALPPAA